MAVTDTEHTTERSTEVEQPRESEHSTEVEEPREFEERDEDRQRDDEGRARDGERDEPQATAESPDDEAESEDSGESEEPEKRKRFKGIAGGASIFLLLGIYFVWIGSEMGAHAISGTFEMWAIFGAIFLGVAALVAGGAISRRKNDD